MHANAPLSAQGRLRLVQRCQTRPIAHVAAEPAFSRSGASKWVNCYRRNGKLGLLDRSSVPKADAARPCRVRSPRHQPHRADRHRQRGLQSGDGVRPSPARVTPPANHFLHPTPQRESRTLQADPPRGVPLRPDLAVRRPAPGCPWRVEHPLQLPPTPQRRRRAAARHPATRWRDERRGLLYPDSPCTVGAVAFVFDAFVLAATVMQAGAADWKPRPQPT